MIRNLAILGLISGVFSLPAIAKDPGLELNLLKLRCSRTEKSNDQTYLSIIHFVKAGQTTVKNTSKSAGVVPSGPYSIPAIEGEVLSYAVLQGEQRFISGYNLFAISYHDSIISGMTGDPYTRTDGSFTLIPMTNGIEGYWEFSYTGVSGQLINAEFFCNYSDRNIEI